MSPLLLTTVQLTHRSGYFIRQFRVSAVMELSRERGRGSAHRGSDRGGSRRGQRGGGPPPSRGASPGRGPSSFRGRGDGPPQVQVFAPGSPARLDPSHQDLDSLTSRFRTLSTSVPDRIVRPGFGKHGTPVTLRANFFTLKYPKNCVLYDHRVKISPEVETTERRLRKRLFELFEGSKEVAPFLGSIAHDGTERIIAKRPLPNNFSVSVPFYEEGQVGPHPNSKVYTISVLEPTELRSADLDRYLQGDDPLYNPSPIVSAFNLITTSHAAHTGVLCGKNRYFFHPSMLNEAPARLGGILEAWKGFFASVRPVYKNLMVNVNVSMGAFYVPYARLSDALLQFRVSSTGAGYPEELDGCVRITTTYLGYRKRSTIKAIGRDSARKSTFQCDELGGKVSVERYFQQKYNIRLEHPDDIPVINIGNRTKDVYVPAELCEIEPGQSYDRILAAKQTKEMIRAACKPPYVNAQTISSQGLGVLGLRQSASPMQGFGLKVDHQFAVVPARVLDPPTVLYQSRQLRVANGSWNLLGTKFPSPASLMRAAILVLKDGGDDDFSHQGDSALTAVVSGFLDICRASGMLVKEKPPIRVVPLPRPYSTDPLRSKAIDEIERAISSFPGDPNLVLVFMSGPDIYPGLKRLCDMKLGIHTVCMLTPNIRNKRRQDQYLANVSLKVNAKLGGVNHRIHQNSLRWLKNTMLVGMDVTHPGGGSRKGTPSIAAVVASCDGDFMHYPASLELQEHRVEIVQHVKKMMIERIKHYHQRMKAYPERIVVFRDGVSEGQFDQVLEKELPEIKEAFKDKTFGNYNPKLTIAICGKRHHTRFYPTKVEDADRTSNTKAGTVVDKGVTAVYDFDFYLQAHTGLQGTVRATHYSVIYDEIGFQADELQQGANDMSYLWACATKSVSLIPPAYWADRACDRARRYLNGILNPPKGSPESRMSEDEIWNKAKEVWGNGIHEKLKGTMFYL